MNLKESILNILHEELYNVDFNESLTGVTPTGTTQQLINKPVKLIGDVNTTTIIQNVNINRDGSVNISLQNGLRINSSIPMLRKFNFGVNIPLEFKVKKKNMGLLESIKRILREETEDLMSCLPMFRQFKMPEDGFVVTDEKYGISNIDKFFWRVVDLVDYKSDNDYDRIREMFLNLNGFCGVSAEVFKALKEALKIKLDALDKRWGDDIREVGDDSWSDLRADIISRGRDFYNKAMTDFDMVQRMANEMDFEESFSYAFPYEKELI